MESRQPAGSLESTGAIVGSATQRMASSRGTVMASTSEQLPQPRIRAAALVARTRATTSATKANESVAFSATLLGAAAAGSDQTAKFHLLRLRCSRLSLLS